MDAAAATALEAHIDALAGATRDAAADGFAPERLVPSLDGGPSSRFAEDIADAAAAFAVEVGARVGGDRARDDGDARRTMNDAARDAAARTRACVDAVGDALEKTFAAGEDAAAARNMKEWHLAQLVGDAARLNAEAAAWQRAAAANAVRVLVAGGDEDVVDDDDEEDEAAIAREDQSRDPISAPARAPPARVDARVWRRRFDSRSRRTSRRPRRRAIGPLSRRSRARRNRR